jgi:hypothetical protein
VKKLTKISTEESVGLLSVSKKSGFAAHRHKDFETKTFGSVNELARIISSEVWSPIVFKGGVRASANFVLSTLIALDFDSGKYTLHDALTDVRTFGLFHVLGTTKSHQKQKITKAGKVEPPCDRFRLILLGPECVHDGELYTYNMREYMELFPDADKSCKDAARFFFPCAEIVSAGDGRCAPWIPLPPDYVPMKELRAKKRAELANYPVGVYPAWMRQLLERGAPPGERHKTCYKLGAYMSGMGYDTSTIVRLCMAGPLRDIGLSDVRRAVENGVKAAGDDL